MSDKLEFDGLLYKLVFSAIQLHICVYIDIPN